MPGLEKALIENFDEFSQLRTEIDANDFDADPDRVAWRKPEAGRTWYEVTGPVVTQEFQSQFKSGAIQSTS